MTRAVRTVLIILLAVLPAACVSTTSNDQGAIQNDSKPDYVEAAKLNTQLGIDYARQNQDDLAMEKLKRALEQDPRLPAAHSTIAYLYAKRGEDGEADKHYRRALELDPKDASTKNNYGVFLCAHQRAVEAGKLFHEAAADKQYRSPEVALTNAGVCERKKPDLAAAERDFRAALKANPNFADALSQMAWLSYQQKDYLRARAFLQRYQQAGPATPETLLIGALTEKALGDTVAAGAYEQRLRKEFPESDESGSLPHASAP
ncbi:MAG: Type pilus assembly protein PilF [Hydrocarboniphaga sp.]|uniref:type IV pilus biogenesis/stability protein PilW n=1 Tax=Hydrocarboniphaga sp. TaxID=2033016 RepID=UPI00262638C3|nr:type IV pilus biogenesis/stability protein PilW [Hydrocarboniphaga sp.]MDB5971085.1 Type pilus assembly protein PilF [Hydrocarboniphaga sp.]